MCVTCARKVEDAEKGADKEAEDEAAVKARKEVEKAARTPAAWVDRDADVYATVLWDIDVLLRQVLGSRGIPGTLRHMYSHTGTITLIISAISLSLTASLSITVSGSNGGAGGREDHCDFVRHAVPYVAVETRCVGHIACLCIIIEWW